MSLPLLETVDPWYAGAVGAAMVALLVALAVAHDAYRDLTYVRRLGIGNGRLRIARTELRFEIARTVVVALLGIAAIATTILTAGRGPVDLEPLAFAPRITLLSAFLVIVWDGIEALRYRAWLRSTYAPPARTPATVAPPEEDARDAL